jgi:hypothetical protein
MGDAHQQLSIRIRVRVGVRVRVRDRIRRKLSRIILLKLIGLADVELQSNQIRSVKA